MSLYLDKKMLSLELTIFNIHLSYSDQYPSSRIEGNINLNIYASWKCYIKIKFKCNPVPLSISVDTLSATRLSGDMFIVML